MARIQFGIFPITEDWPNGADMARVYNEIVAEAQMAESVGFDSCLITEHHQQADGYFPNPLMVSAGVARETTTLKVGSCVALAPLYNPIRLTEDSALLDVISGGRLILGLGASYVSEDLAAFGVDVTQRGPLMEDTVRFLTEAWTQDHLDFDGEVFHFKNMRVTPKPVQQPRPPIWLGAWTPQGLRRAGRIGDRLDHRRDQHAPRRSPCSPTSTGSRPRRTGRRRPSPSCGSAGSPPPTSRRWPSTASTS